jgi:hypothetical protein
MSICLNPYYMKFPVKNIQFITALLALAAVYVGCTKGPDIKSYSYPAPEPKAVFPDTGYAGFATVTITGTQFGDYKQAVKVFFGGIQSDSILSCENGKIVARVPAAAVTGKVGLQVWTHTIDSIGEFTVMPNPVIRSINETAGVPGDVILISGANFGSDITKVNVDFNGTPGSVNSVADSTVSVTVPANFNTGKISLNVNNFNVAGPTFGLLVAIPTPVYSLAFEGDLIDKISGVAATYTWTSPAKDIDWGEGVKGKAVKLFGAQNQVINSQYIKLPANISKHKELTVTAWVYWNNDSTAWTQEPIFDAGNARGQRICLMTRMNTTFGTGYQNLISRSVFENINGYGTPATYYNAIGKGPLPKKEWHHVALVFSYANLVEKIYMDGIQYGSVDLVATADHTVYSHSKVYIGGPTNGSKNEPAFGGMIDNFRIYNQALNADQIATDAYKK